MSKKKSELQPDLAYIDSEGNLRDDGLHDEMLSSKAGNAASQKAARDAAIKSGMSKATAEKFYGRVSQRRRKQEARG